MIEVNICRDRMMKCVWTKFDLCISTTDEYNQPITSTPNKQQIINNPNVKKICLRKKKIASSNFDGADFRLIVMTWLEGASDGPSTVLDYALRVW